ncbi:MULTISPECIES: peptide chain release factor N(5)-glutamine methyltransferase [unclassified Arenibacter]|jgi:release factor glutamine methyltransferase|uniref:peptide chain release factor N(5)-glutamine methyltransferase n=1 Tax=unclassified Arenibacter TaxID=2615047 RepID=UPI000E3533CD|nr:MULTISPECIES: peptide chain release factor N(5)-glutamine methyltransferase [unclassified Arenibacter]MCM4163521.1 peptide chain release factor N(5)-glutamine methyltransferase [Arenibacter sp. A80]RFT57511.1 peptide chain release factor N(5)-glutamine methyltransferase [Arenibacter sp. P308M17]
MLLKEIKDIYHLELDPIFPKEEVDSFFYLVIDHYLGLERFVLAMQPKLMVPKEEEEPLFYALSQLKLERPIQYILGKAHFCELVFHVNENVLIPRPETEELVYWILKEVQKRSSREGLRILDIGTGSGCIAISLAKNLPNAQVYAIDVSKKALQVAGQNAMDNGVDIVFLERDILFVEGLKDKFDIIVSNPPYVRELEKLEMKNNVVDNEPGLALFVPDRDPLIFYKKITHLALGHLKKNGILFFEINQYLGKEMKQLLEANNFSEIELGKDMYGNDRMLKGCLM